MSPEQLLAKAQELVTGPRAEQHGDYCYQHRRAAELWSAYLDAPIGAEQVAMCMLLLKVSRSEFGKFNEDDGLDATAYSAIWCSLCDD